MRDSYRAVYDAVAFQFSDASRYLEQVRDEVFYVSAAMQRPSVLYRPSVVLDGNKWCALYGADLMNGVAGFGDTPSEAMADFDKKWNSERAPQARKP